MVFLWVHGLPWGLRLCLSFELMSFMCFFRFVCTVIWKRRGGLPTQGLRGVVSRISDCHPHRHSAWQRTERRQVYRDTEIMEMGWAMWAYADTGVTEKD